MPCAPMQHVPGEAVLLLVEFRSASGRNLFLTVGIRRSSEWKLIDAILRTREWNKTTRPRGHLAQYLACRYPSEMCTKNASVQVMQISSDLTAQTAHRNFLIKFPVTRDQAAAEASLSVLPTRKKKMISPSLSTTVQTYWRFSDVAENKFFPRIYISILNPFSHYYKTKYQDKENKSLNCNYIFFFLFVFYRHNERY